MPNQILAQLQSQKWVMEPNALKVFIERLAELPATAVLPLVEVKRPVMQLQIINGVAVIPISGVLLKSVKGWMRLWGLNVTGYDEIREQVEAAVVNKSVKSIQLNIDSPGGTVAGVLDAADAIYEARQVKPVRASVENLAASGAYWLASQAQEIGADRNAEVGSIGVYTVYVDWTKAEEKWGIKVIVIRHGEHKGMGIDSITENQIEVIQEIIDALADNFIDAVARGREKDIEKVSEWATGRLWIATAAREMGLIDTVIVNNQNQTNGNIKGDQSMEEQKENNAHEAKTKEQDEKMNKLAVEEARLEERERLMEFKAAFPDDLEFAIDACGRGLSVTEAKAEYCDVLEARLKENAIATEHVEGAEPLEYNDSKIADGNDFVTAAKELAKAEKIKLGDAFKRVAREQPELYQDHRAGLGLQRTAVA